MSLDTAALVAFVGTEDLDRARAFYEGTLGLMLKEQSPFALEFFVGGTMLRVTKVAECRPAPYTVLGWSVNNIEAAIDSLSAKGVHFGRYPGMIQDARGVWNAPGGARVAWFKDPDGNTLSLAEF